MPQTMKYLEPNDKERREFYGEAEKERKGRRENYELAKKYLEGNQTKPLAKLEGEPDDNVIVNLVKLATERAIAFLWPRMPTFELEEGNPEQSPDEKWLGKAWEFSRGLSLLHEVTENGTLAGHNYVRVLPPQPGKIYPRAINLDPRLIVTYWKADDVDTVVWHEQQWTVNKDHYLNDYVYYPDEGIWRIFSYARRTGPWVLQTSEDWKSAHGPVYSWKHLPNPNTHYGRASVGQSQIQLQDSVNLLFSEMKRITRYWSSPKTIVTGVDSEEDLTEVQPGEMWSTPNENARAFNIEMLSQMSPIQTLAGTLYDNYLAEQRIVILRGEVKDFQRVTNAGVRTVFIDMIAQNEILRSLHGTATQEISRRMMFAAGKGDTAEPLIKNVDPLPRDDKERVDIDAIEIATGTQSIQGAILAAGRNVKDVMQKRSEEENWPGKTNPMQLMEAQAKLQQGAPKEDPKKA